MARLAWIASELGSATGFPKDTIIPQKSPPDEDPECWRDAAYSIRHTPRRYSLLTAGVYRTGQLPYCRQSFHNRAPSSRIRLDANAIIDG